MMLLIVLKALVESALKSKDVGAMRDMYGQVKELLPSKEAEEENEEMEAEGGEGEGAEEEGAAQAATAAAGNDGGRME